MLSRNDMRYRHEDKDKRQKYASSDRNDKHTTRTARLSPEDKSLDHACPGYRESNTSDTRRVHTHDRDVSPVRDDSSRRVPQRGDYPDYDTFDKGPRVFDDPRRGTGTAERSQHPEAINGQIDPVSSQETYAQNQGPGRSTTLSMFYASGQFDTMPWSIYPSDAPAPFLTPAIQTSLPNAKRWKVVMAILYYCAGAL